MLSSTKSHPQAIKASNAGKFFLQISFFFLLVTQICFAQHVTNTLGTNGVFSIKDGATTFLSLRQSDGYLGIGTLTPQSKFDVNGNAQIRGNLSLSVTNPYIAFNDNGYIQSYDDNHRIAFDRLNNILSFQEWGTIVFSTTGQKVERMRIANNGNVGIGTNNPYTGRLVVDGSVHAGGYNGTAFRIGDDTRLVDIDLANTIGVYGIQDSTRSSIKLGQNGGTISGYNGNIGIGTLTPSWPLEVRTIKAVAEMCNDSTGVAGYGKYGVFGKGLYGVYGDGTYGVIGNGTYGVYGDGAYGVYGKGNSYGVYGYTNVNEAYGVYGEGTGYKSVGVYGKGPEYGVYGNGVNYGVYGYGNYGVYGRGNTYGVYGRGDGSIGVYATATFGIALYTDGRCQLNGNVTVDGILEATFKRFKIDHPLDPANKYLMHSCVESSEAMNIYNGNIITDGAGFATVTLPDWFEALNKDFRYQLTVIGSFAQAIISKEIQNNQFEIRTDKPGVKVSWQVTGVRHDAFMEKYPMQVEVEKTGEEKGKYLHPEAFGLPETMGISYQQRKRIEEGVNK